MAKRNLKSESLEDFFRELLEPFTPEEMFHFKTKSLDLCKTKVTDTSDLLEEVENLVSGKKRTHSLDIKEKRIPKSKLHRRKTRKRKSMASSEDDTGDFFKFVKKNVRKEMDFRKVPPEDSKVPYLIKAMAKHNKIKKLRSKEPKETVWEEIVSPDGQIYYYNKSTKERTWEKPNGLKTASEKCLFNSWKEYKFNDGTVYFYNSNTKESSWKIPIELEKHETKNTKELKKKYDDIREKFRKNLLKKLKTSSSDEKLERKFSKTCKKQIVEKQLKNTNIKRKLPKNVLVKTALVCLKEALETLSNETSGSRLKQKPVNHSQQITNALSHIVEAQNALSASISSVTCDQRHPDGLFLLESDAISRPSLSDEEIFYNDHFIDNETCSGSSNKD